MKKTTPCGLLSINPIKNCCYQKVLLRTGNFCNLLKLVLIRNEVLTIVKIFIAGMLCYWDYLIIGVFILLV